MRNGIAPKRLVAFALIATFAFALSGCVYLRLLNFKNQLKAFDRNVKVENASGLSLAFPHPIVRDSDFTFITRSPPTRSRTLSQRTEAERWTWTFRKRKAKPEHKAYSIDFETDFESGLLTRMKIDDDFVDLIGRDFILAMFGSIGEAKINTLKRSASASVDARELDNVTFPALARIIDEMGPPSRKIPVDDFLQYEYEFNFHNPTSDRRSGQFKLTFIANPHAPAAPIAGVRITGRGR